MSHGDQEGIMNEHLRRAINALESGASEVRELSSRSSSQARNRLRQTVEEVLEHLEADDQSAEPDPEDVVSRLDRKSREIAEDLRRIDRLMKRRTGQE
jgi:DNA invertase Pin-like site-specific DNA recombinase